ncbi:MAG: signal peptidase I [Candidatus Aenigmarchaeota archaeon]|nr:signal peptidase I [Candidatus Aenigmarchaeota archaeon]
MRFRIEDRSMEPTLKSGDYIIVNKLAYVFGKPSKGDVIVFKDPKEKNKFLVKRVSKIISNKYFVVGDNKRYSQDSRHFGPINKNLIVGKLLMHIRQ